MCGVIYIMVTVSPLSDMKMLKDYYYSEDLSVFEK